MGRALITPLSQIDLSHPVGIERVPLVGVDNYYEKTRVSVDHLGLVAGLKVPEDGGIVKEGKVNHVLHLLKLRWIDFAHLGSLMSELLMTYRNHTLASGVLQVTRLKQTLPIALSLGVRDPYRLLGIIRFGLISPLHIHGGQKELSGIRISLSRLGELDVARHGDKSSVSAKEQKPKEREKPQ
jgi:hypothetical protein